MERDSEVLKGKYYSLLLPEVLRAKIKIGVDVYVAYEIHR